MVMSCLLSCIISYGKKGSFPLHSSAYWRIFVRKGFVRMTGPEVLILCPGFTYFYVSFMMLVPPPQVGVQKEICQSTRKLHFLLTRTSKKKQPLKIVEDSRIIFCQSDVPFFNSPNTILISLS